VFLLKFKNARARVYNLITVNSVQYSLMYTVNIHYLLSKAVLSGDLGYRGNILHYNKIEIYTE
jgi:hypothetical protein